MSRPDSTPLLVLVSGPPAAGKTTIARALASRLRLPLVSKDDIKEALADSLGASDGTSRSKELGAAAWEVLFALLERFLQAGASAVFESNFYPHVQRDRFAELQRRLPHSVFEVHCTADPATLVRRDRQRPRHPVHTYSGSFRPEEAAEWIEANSALELGGHLVRLDTGGVEPVDLDAIVVSIREASRDGLRPRRHNDASGSQAPRSRP